MNRKDIDSKPWYRHPWPWILMAIPAASIVVGMAMLTLAINSPGDVVVDNYYEEGRGINQSFAMDHAAEELGISAHLVFESSSQAARIYLQGREEAGLQLRIYHAIDSDRDRTLVFLPIGQGEYHNDSQVLEEVLQSQSNWYVELRNMDDEWRLRKRLRTPAAEMQW